MDFIPEGLFPVEMSAGCVTTNGGITTDNISLKNAVMAYIVVHLKQAVGHATSFAPKRGTLVASAVTALAVSVPIWYGNVSTSSNSLTRQTDAVSFAVPVGDTGDCIIVFQIDPAQLGKISTTEAPVIGMAVSDSSQATNFASIMVFLVPRYAEPTANAPSYITD